jgi:hypothetical protein
MAGEPNSLKSFPDRFSSRQPGGTVSRLHANASIKGNGSDRAADHAEHRDAPHFIPRRQPRELALDEVENASLTYPQERVRIRNPFAN